MNPKAFALVVALCFGYSCNNNILPVPTPSVNARPIITSWSPKQLKPGQNNKVAFTGANFRKDTVWKAGLTPLSATYVSQNLVSAVITAATIRNAKLAANATVTVTVTAANNGVVSAPVNITVAQATLPISGSLVLPNAALGVAYNVAINPAPGVGTPPYIWSLAPSSLGLPIGLSLQANGQISGTPAAKGTFTFSLVCTDSLGAIGTLGPITISVYDPIKWTNGPVPAATNGTPYSYQFQASGGVGPYQFSAIGTLPPGLTLSSSGLLSGTPTMVGSFDWQLQIKDSTANATTLRMGQTVQ